MNKLNNYICFLFAFSVVSCGDSIDSNKQVAAPLKLEKDGLVVVDETKRLMWMRCSLGSEFTAEAERVCSPEATRFYKSELKDIKLDYAGFSDWRVPTVEELYSIVKCKSGMQIPFLRTASGEIYSQEKQRFNGGCEPQDSSYAIDFEMFPDAGNHVLYWTSTKIRDVYYHTDSYGIESVAGRDGIFIVDFKGGFVYSNPAGDEHLKVRLVRDIN